MLRTVNRRSFLKKTIYSFTSFFIFNNFLMLFFSKKKKNINVDILIEDYFFAIENYRKETVYNIFSLYLKGDNVAKKIIQNISKRRTRNNYFHKINIKYLWKKKKNINI